MRRNGIALLVLIACHSDPPRAEAQYAKPPPPQTAGSGMGTGTALRPAQEGTGSKPVVHGAAHYAQISEVAVSSDGTAALTRDAMGGVRVWPSLDGSLEPRIVPIASPAALSIDRRADGIVAAIVDGSGAGHVVTINKDGRIAVGGLPIDPAITSLTVLPGGDRVIGVRADQSIGLYDTTGALVDEATLRSMRVAKLLPRRDGAKAVALVTTTVKGKPGAALVPIDAAGKLHLGAAIALPLPLAAGVTPAGAVSPKGTRIAYLGQPAGGAAQLVVADAATGAEIKIPEAPAIATPMQTAIGWTGDDKLYVVGTNGGWRIELGATIDVFASAQAPRMTLPSFGTEALVGGYGAHLAIERTDGTLRFLGYSELSPTAVSIAPGGRTVMWITSSGALMKETLDGGEVLVRTPNEWYGSVAAVDDHTALAGRNSGVLALIDMDTGKELATLPVAASTPFLQYSAKRKLVAVMAQASVVWLIPVDRAAAQPLGKPAVIADGAQTFQLLETSDDAVLLTYDNAWKGRIYTAAELAKGVSAAQMKKDRFAAGGTGYVHDRSAQTYVLNGTEVQVWRKGTKVRAFQVETASALSAAPDGSRIAVTTQSGAIAVYDADGKKLWSVGAGSFAYGVSWSDDGALLAIATQGGGLVIDAATGTARVQSCGWKFTLDTAVPQILPQNVPTVCR